MDTVAILLIDEERKFLVARAAKGLEEEVEQGVRIPVGQGFAGRIAAEQAAIFIADMDHADILNPILREKGIRSLLGVPLVVEGESIGVLHVGTLTPRAFTNEDAALLQLAATHAAPALERAGSSRRSSASIASRWPFSGACFPSGCRRCSASASTLAICPRRTRSVVTGTT